MNPVLPTTNPQNVGKKNPASSVVTHLGGKVFERESIMNQKTNCVAVIVGEAA